STAGTGRAHWRSVLRPTPKLRSCCLGPGCSESVTGAQGLRSIWTMLRRENGSLRRCDGAIPIISGLSIRLHQPREYANGMLLHILELIELIGPKRLRCGQGVR